MLIDSFLFFQELDLLEIRLEYLFPFVDKFLIVESCQTFKGEYKTYNFEKNKERFKKYLEKIYYYKIETFYENSFKLIQDLKNGDDKEKEFLYKLIKNHNHYEKTFLPFILDSYQRECIHIPLKKISKDSDKIIFSDLDEIPSLRFIEHLKSKSKLDGPIVCKQLEFKYFLNSLNAEDWLGSISAEYSYIKNKSLNLLRKDSLKLKKFNPGGYHFTSVGGIDSLKYKIENWTHQEFNTSLIKKNLNKNIKIGRDIFYRLGIKKNNLIDIQKDYVFDKRIKSIIINYDDLFINEFIKESLKEFIEYKFIQILIYTNRILKNPVKAILKVNKILIICLVKSIKKILKI